MTPTTLARTLAHAFREAVVRNARSFRIRNGQRRTICPICKETHR